MCTRTLRLQCSAILISLLLSLNSYAVCILHVDGAATGENNGSSWENAYNYLQDALYIASIIDCPAEIHIAQGVYYPDDFTLLDRPSMGRNETFELCGGTVLLGGYAGVTTKYPDRRDIDAFKTILCGDLNSDDRHFYCTNEMIDDPYRSENCFHVVTVPEYVTNCYIEGVTIMGGHAYDASVDPPEKYYGGGIQVLGSADIIQCTFKSNTAGWGGGLYLRSGGTVENCLFNHNAVTNHAGAMVVLGSLVDQIINCQFIDNYAGSNGGAVWNFDTNPHYKNCLFAGNQAERAGGAIWNVDYSSYKCTNCTFVYNRGGAISSDYNVQATNCIFWMNTGGLGITEEESVCSNAYPNYCFVQGWTGEYQSQGVGNFGGDPFFVDNGGWVEFNHETHAERFVCGDYHLQSQAGHFNSYTPQWILDDVTSPCIDAGDPEMSVGDETMPNGGIINVGFYGGTLQASRSWSGQVCILHVDAAATGTNDGFSWENAFTCLQDALHTSTFASCPTEIHIAQGVYRPDQFTLIERTSMGRAETFELTEGIVLKGGFAGVTTPHPDMRNIDAFKTILSGDLLGNDQDFICPQALLDDPCRNDNSYHVVTVPNTVTNCLLEGFTITGGHSYNELEVPPMGHYGGGIHFLGTGKIIRCTFRDNTAGWGGGLYAFSGGCYVRDCIFDHNAAFTHAGAMEVFSGKGYDIVGCRFTHNYAGKQGGAVWNFDVHPHYINCLFAGNQADWGGGAVWNVDSGLYTFTNCTFVHNRAMREGGAVDTDAKIFARNCIFWMNSDRTGINENSHVNKSNSFNYCCVQGWTGELTGVGNFGEDPLFVENGGWMRAGPDCEGPRFECGDYHLKSQAGHFSPQTGQWIMDDKTSLCIDAGDFATPIGYELFPNGGIVNVGTYGGTVQASRSWFGDPPCQVVIAGDINGDCQVNLLDLAILASHWCDDSRMNN